MLSFFVCAYHSSSKCLCLLMNKGCSVSKNHVSLSYKSFSLWILTFCTVRLPLNPASRILALRLIRVLTPASILQTPHPSLPSTLLLPMLLLPFGSTAHKQGKFPFHVTRIPAYLSYHLKQTLSQWNGLCCKPNRQQDLCSIPGMTITSAFMPFRFLKIP